MLGLFLLLSAHAGATATPAGAADAGELQQRPQRIVFVQPHSWSGATQMLEVCKELRRRGADVLLWGNERFEQ